MRNPFCSSHLEYHIVRDTRPQDFPFVHTLHADVASAAHLPQQPSADDQTTTATSSSADQWTHHLMTNTLLSVIISISPPLPTTFSPDEPDPEPIGIISLSKPLPHDRHPGGEHQRESTISVAMLAAHRANATYAAEAVEWMLDWGFRSEKLHRVGIECVDGDGTMMRLCEGELGFVREGCRREAVWWRGRWRDVQQYAMLEQEWEMRQKQGRA